MRIKYKGSTEGKSGILKKKGKTKTENTFRQTNFVLTCF